MLPAQFLRFFFVSLICIFIIGCMQTSTQQDLKLSQNGAKGKQLFIKHECGKCHSTGESGKIAASKTPAPDLTNPFLANDSSFVKAHLKFIEETKMPEINLSEEDIRLLSYYVAELYNARLPELPREEIDAYDPVCYAPVSKRRARQANLVAKYLDQTYYFATIETLETFKKAPEAFIELFTQHKKENLAMQF